MKCTWQFKGHTFDSELELDEFILNGGVKLYSKYGDSVFSKPISQTAVNSKVESFKEKGAEKLFEKNDKYDNPFGSELEFEAPKKPRIGVTEFLEGLENIETGKLFFPEFITDTKEKNGETIIGYFPRKIEEWKRGVFSTQEIELFFDGDKTKVNQAFTNEQLMNFRQQLENKWKQQALIGTEIHKAFAYLLRTEHDGETVTASRDESWLFEAFRPKINSELLPDENLKQVIKYAKDLYNYLESIDDYKGATYHPEFVVWGDFIDAKGEQREFVGKLDLLLIDKRGISTIIDYKTSPDDFQTALVKNPTNTDQQYSKVKLQSFKYQLATYSILAKNMGIASASTKLFVAPIQLINFKKKDDVNWQFDGLKEYNNFLYNLTENLIESSQIEANLRQYFRDLTLSDSGVENIITELDEEFKQYFNNINLNTTEEDIARLIDERAVFNEDTNQWIYESGTGSSRSFSGKEEMTNWLSKMLKTQNAMVESVTEKIAEYINSKNDVDKHLSLASDKFLLEFNDGSLDWADKTFDQYLNGDYSVIDTDVFKKLWNVGILAIKNEYTKNIDVIKISNNILYGYTLQAEGQRKLSAKFVLDVEETSNPNSKMLEGNRGNMELMYTMLALNRLPESLRGYSINQVRVINPKLGSGTPVSNEELDYTFRTMNKYAKEKGLNVKNNNFESAIKLSNPYNQFIDKYRDAVRRHLNTTDNRWNAIVNCSNDFDKNVVGFDNVIVAEAKLRELMDLMESKYSYLSGDVDNLDLNDEVSQLYYRASQALSFLNNVDYVQQFEKSDRYLDNINILRSGATGTRLDNPGNLKNSNLNKTVQQTTIAYQNIRERMQDLKAELRTAMENLKKDKNFGYFGAHLFKNKVDLFTNLYRRVNGDLYFKELNDPSLLESERKLLEIALRIINTNRQGNKTPEQLQAMESAGTLSYYRVPLTPGGMNSFISVEGLMKTAKDWIKRLKPKRAAEEFDNSEAGFIAPTQAPTQKELFKTVDLPNHSIGRANLWKMTTMFDAGELDVSRKMLLSKHTEGYFEHDLENLILKHEFAYRQKDAMDKILPLIKAGMLNIRMQEIMTNTKYDEDIQYIKDYVKNKIYNRSLVDDKYKSVMYYKSLIMRTASRLALGFNPKQLYQNLEGIWKDIKLVIAKPDGSYNFSSKDMFLSFKDVMKEAWHFGNTRSKLELINELYALNDMDMEPNTYVERLMDDKSLLYNFDTLCFRFASRPDFYNRLTIFEAHMRHDGCWDAHSVQNGRLIYDWKKDTRFDQIAGIIESNNEFSNVRRIVNNSENKELKNQFALYVKYIKQLQSEGTTIKDANGVVRAIKLGDILPKAYTTQQSEGYKSVSDMLYGYYAHEKKALFQSTFAGSLLLQMYTYWSGKKNQYFAQSSPKLNGHYEQLTHNGVQYWMDENGNPTDIVTGIPYIVWRGQFQEGIAVTLHNMAQYLKKGIHDEGLIKGLPQGYEMIKNNMFGDTVPENLKTAYIYNLKALTYDLAAWLIVGNIMINALSEEAKSYVKDNQADNIGQALTNNSIMLGSNLLETSFVDFNFLESIGGRGINWTPFSVSMMTNTYVNFKKFLTGEQDLKKTAIKFTSASRQLHQVLDYLWDDSEERQALLDKRREEREEKQLNR